MKRTSGRLALCAAACMLLATAIHAEETATAPAKSAVRMEARESLAQLAVALKPVTLAPDAKVDPQLEADCKFEEALGTDVGKTRAVGVAGVAPRVEQRHHRRDVRRIGEADEDPRPLLRPVDQPGVGKDPQVPRHPRLALPEDQRQLADSQLEPADERDDAQPRRVGEGAQDRQRRGHRRGI